MECEKDELLQYFQEQYNQKLKKYSTRLSIQDLSALQPKQIKSQFKFLNESFLNESDPTKQGNKEYILPSIEKIGGNYMRSAIDNQIYSIFCQAPQQWSYGEFWKTCYEQNVKKIFVLCAKSFEYWPQRNQELQFPQVNIKVRTLWEETVNLVLIRRPIKIQGPQGDRQLQHLHFIKWRDGGVPQGEIQLEAFRMMVQQAIKHIENKQMILVHCMAGLGRTGTFGAVVQATRSFNKFKAVSLFQIVKKMRADRHYCVQRQTQYNFALLQATKLK